MNLNDMFSPIRIIHFKKTYKDIVIELDDIIFSKQITLLVGKNGSGKSTIIKAIAGMIKYQGIIDKEYIRFSYMCEVPVYPLDLSVLQFLISLNNIEHQKVEDDVIIDLLVQFDMDDKINTRLSDLSKGMKAKVNLIQCLMSKADVYLLDEPLSGLDHEGIRTLIQYLKQSSKQFIISTHLIDDFNGLNSQVVQL